MHRYNKSCPKAGTWVYLVILLLKELLSRYFTTWILLKALSPLSHRKTKAYQMPVEATELTAGLRLPLHHHLPTKAHLQSTFSVSLQAVMSWLKRFTMYPLHGSITLGFLPASKPKGRIIVLETSVLLVHKRGGLTCPFWYQYSNIWWRSSHNAVPMEGRSMITSTTSNDIRKFSVDGDRWCWVGDVDDIGVVVGNDRVPIAASTSPNNRKKVGLPIKWVQDNLYQLE